MEGEAQEEEDVEEEVEEDTDIEDKVEELEEQDIEDEEDEVGLLLVVGRLARHSQQRRSIAAMKWCPVRIVSFFNSCP